MNKYFKYSLILTGFLSQSVLNAASLDNNKIISNSPVKAGKIFKLNVEIPPECSESKVSFNGEKRILPANLHTYKVPKIALNKSRVFSDPNSPVKKAVSPVAKYTSLVSVKMPQDGKKYYIWANAKGGSICIKSNLNGKQKELKWNWISGKNYSWRFMGCYDNSQVGTSFSLMNDTNTKTTAVAGVLLTTDQGYKPDKNSFYPGRFLWQTDESSVGTHYIPLRMTVGGKTFKRKIKIKVLKANSAKSSPKLRVPNNQQVNISLGEQAKSLKSLKGFNCYNSDFVELLKKRPYGINFPVSKKILALKCKKFPKLPSEYSIPINSKFAGLAFLNTEYWQGEVGQQVAFYKIVYSDSSSITIPIREEFELSGSLRSPKTRNSIYLTSSYSSLTDFHVSLFTWKNPHPQKTIRKVIFSNALSRFSEEENKIIPLNVTGMSSQILLSLTGIKSSKDTAKLIEQQKSKKQKNLEKAYVTVDFRKVSGKINPYLFSTNETFQMQTDNPVYKAYSKRMAQIGCRMFRLHGGWRLTSVYPKGLNGPKLYPKLDKGIRDILKDGPNRVIMICINYVPKYINPKKAEDREHFANLCADLLEHFEKEKIPVKYWEIFNEAHFEGVDGDYSLWEMFNLTAKKLKAINPSIKIGGYAPCWPSISNMRHFYKFCNKDMDFISWHKYPTGSSKTSDAYIMASTNTFGSDTRAIKKMVQQVTPGRKIEFALTEYNINWNWKPHDPRQATHKGAVWLASVLNHLIRAEADIAQTWHSYNGGTFGLISNNLEVRPAAKLLSLCNRFLKDKYILAQSNDKLVECLGFVEKGKQIGLLLINKANHKKQVKITCLNLPQIPVNFIEGNASEYTIGPNGFEQKNSNIENINYIKMNPFELKIFVVKNKQK